MTAFGKLFWGFLLVLLDFRINGFDILIDFLGYALILAGLSELATRNEHFARARPFAIVLLALSVLDVWQEPPTSSGTNVDVGLFGSIGLAILFSLAVFAVNLALVYNICRGIAQLATAAGKHQLAITAMNRWALYLGTQIAGVLFLVIAFATRDAAVGLLIIVVLAGLIAAILLAALMRQADKTLTPRGY